MHIFTAHAIHVAMPCYVIHKRTHAKEENYFHEGMYPLGKLCLELTRLDGLRLSGLNLNLLKQMLPVVLICLIDPTGIESSVLEIHLQYSQTYIHCSHVE